jgi:HlyD family secretion protein
MSAKKARRRRELVWAGVGLALVAFFLYAFWPRAIVVDLGEVTRGPLRVTVSDEGQTRIREVFTVSAPLSGRLLRVERHAGDVVTGGSTVVAQLEPTDPSFLDIRTRAQAEAAVKAAEAALSLASAELDRARAELDFASSELKRTTALVEKGTASQVALDRARLAYRTSQAQLATADAAHHVKEFELETAKALLIDPAQRQTSGSAIPLLTPVTGRILRVMQESEAVLTPGTPIMEIGDTSDLEIEVDLLTTDAVAVKAGAPARITGWGGPGSLNAKVRLIEPYGFTKVSALGIEEQRVKVIVDLIDPPDKWAGLGHGYRVDVAIVVDEIKNAVRVPLGALFRSDKSWAVFRVERGRARETKIEIGPSDGTEAAVLKGLKPGTRVVLYPSDRVREGARVAARSR